jgi:hypothetical protein
VGRGRIALCLVVAAIAFACCCSVGMVSMCIVCVCAVITSPLSHEQAHDVVCEYEGGHCTV